MNSFGEGRVLHAMSIDDAYHVERILSQGPNGITELVTIDGSGPYLRKKTPLPLTSRRAWASLSECTCPRLPHVVATYETPDEYVVVRDYVPGDTLAQVVASQGALSADDAARIVQDVCEAASELHAHGAVHCDISPENIVIAADGAHLIDLGIARILGQSPKTEPAPRGTWGFAAPEQYGFAPADERTDVFAIACLLGYLLTGHRPDDDAYDALLSDESVVPAALCSVVRKGSVFEPTARYATPIKLAEAAVFAASSKQVEGGLPAVEVAENVSTVASTSSNVQGTKNRLRRLVKVGACAVGGVLCVACVVCALSWFGMVPGNAWPFGGPPDAQTENASKEISESNSASPQDKRESPSPASDSTIDAPSEGASSADVAAAAKALSIAESSWLATDRGYISYAFVLHNDSSDLTVTCPSVGIVGRDENGRVVFSDDQVLSVIRPKETLYFGSIAGNGAVPATVDFTVKEPAAWFVSRTVGAGAVLRVTDVSEAPDTFGGSSFVGEVSLESGDYFDRSSGQIAVTVLLRDDAGNLVFGTTGFADRPKAGTAATFEVVGWGAPSHSRIEAHAQER